MPYGVDKKKGGDSPSNVKFMEKCVAGISGTNKRTGKSYTKGEKVAICKSQLKKNKSKASLEFKGVDFDVLAKYLANRAMFLHKKMKEEGLTFSQAESLFEATLARIDFDIDRLRE